MVISRSSSTVVVVAGMGAPVTVIIVKSSGDSFNIVRLW